MIVYQTKYVCALFQLSLKRRGSKDLPKSEKKTQQTPTEVCGNKISTSISNTSKSISGHSSQIHSCKKFF